MRSRRLDSESDSIEVYRSLPGTLRLEEGRMIVMFLNSTATACFNVLLGGVVKIILEIRETV